MRKIHAMLLLIICMAVFSACQKQSKDASYPKLVLPKTSIVVSPDATYMIGDQLSKYIQETPTIQTYKFVAPDIKKVRQHLKEQFDVVQNFTSNDNRNYSASENVILEVDKSNGFWTYTNKAIQENIYSSVPSKISVDECKSLAVDIAKIHEVDIDMFSDIIVVPVEYSMAPSEDGMTSDPVAVAYDVYFYPIINGKSVYGVSRFVISFDGDGNVACIKKQYKDIIPYKEETIISLSEAVNKLRAGQASINAATVYEQAEISDYNIVYYADVSPIENQPYMQPIYCLEGTISGSEVEHFISKDNDGLGDNSFMALVAALQVP